MSRWIVLVLVLAGGCFEPQLPRCGELVCDAEAVCIEDTRCASASAVAACDGLLDGASCNTPSFAGTCARGACWFDDVDGDFVPDDVDNCVAIANVEQADGDVDGFGDACDGCPMVATSRNHDEDGDSFGDECDVCPAFPDFQEDADNDGVGDGCDLGADRVAFDAFLTLDPQWERTGEWATTGDAVVPTGASETFGLARPTLTMSGNQMIVLVNIRARRPWQALDQASVELHDDRTGASARCSIACGNACSLGGSFSGGLTGTAFLAPPPTLRLAIAIEITNVKRLTCVAILPTGQLVVTAFTLELSPILAWPRLEASPGIELEAFEAYD